MRSFGVTSFSLLSCLVLLPCIAAADEPPPVAATPTAVVANEAPEEGPEEAPTDVFVGVHIVAIRSLDVRAQSFFADFYLWVRFATKDAERAAEVDAKLEAINGAFESKEEVDRKQIGEQTYVCYRITGTFFFTAKLESYPFDTQSLDLVLENSNLAVDALKFVDDTHSYKRGHTPSDMWGLQPSLRIPEFNILGVTRTVSEAPYPTDFGDPTIEDTGATSSRFTISVKIERIYMSYVFKIVIPLLVILAMAYLVFWLPAKNIDSAAGIIITALLSCMAFNVAVTDNMPEVGYLVLSDKFFMASYVLLLITLAETILTYVIDDRGNAELALRIDRIASWLFPLSVALIFVAVVLAR
jgi:hypothetical protein